MSSIEIAEIISSVKPEEAAITSDLLESYESSPHDASPMIMIAFD